MKAVSYLRVSSDEQRERGTIATQRAAVVEYAAREGITLLDEYADDGVSGAIPFEKRDGGLNLFRDAVTGKFDAVIVWSASRLSRGDKLALPLLLLKLETFGLQVISVSDGRLSAESAEDELMLAIKAYQGRKEREQLRKNIVSGHRRGASEMKWQGGAMAPFGYRVNDGRRLEIDEEQADVVRRIFNWYVNDELSTTKIAARLNADQIPHPFEWNGKHGNPPYIWTASTVSHTLRNSVYLGKYSYNKTKVIKQDGIAVGKERKDESELISYDVPAVVTRELFEMANNLLISNRKMRREGGNGKRFNLLRGLLTCGICGSKYNAHNPRNGAGKVNGYYLCNVIREPYKATARGITCDSKRLRAVELENRIKRELFILAVEPGVYIDQLRERIEQLTEEQQTAQSKSEQLRERLAEIDIARDEILSFVTKRLISQSKADEQLGRLADEETTIRATLDSLQTSFDLLKSNPDDLLRKVSATLRRIVADFGSLTDEEWRGIFLQVIAGIEVNRGLNGNQNPPLAVTFNLLPVVEEG